MSIGSWKRISSKWTAALVLCIVAALVIGPLAIREISAAPGAKSGRASHAAIAVYRTHAIRSAAADFLGEPVGSDAVIQFVAKRGGWGFGTIGIPVRGSGHDAPEGMIFIVHKIDTGWEAAVQYTGAFDRMIAASPDGFPTADIRASLISPRVASGNDPELSLPWATGETWTLMSGPHKGPNAAANSPLTGLDFTNGSGLVRASRGGIAYLDCANRVRIDHGDGFQSTYYHMVDIQVANGQAVSRGQLLGTIGMGVGCGGRAYQNHVHVSVMRNGAEIGIDGVEIGGWKVEAGAIELGGCMVQGNQRRCASRGPIYNDGTIGDNGDGSTAPILRSTSGYCASPEVVELARLINDYRAANGLPAFPLSQILGAAASFHAADMAAHGYRGEVLYDGATWDQNMVDHGYTFPWGRAVDAGSGSATSQQAFDSLIANENSRGAILNVWAGAAMGIAVVHDPNSTYKHNWVVYTGRYLDGAAKVCGTAPTATATVPPSPTATPTKMASQVPTATSQPTKTETVAPTATATSAPTKTATRVPTATKTPTPAPTVTTAPTKTATPKPANTPTTQAACALSVTAGKPGKTSVVSCTGFTPGERVNVWWDVVGSKTLGSFAISSNGTGKRTIQFLDSIAGLHTVIVSSRTSDAQASVGLTIEPSLTRSPSSGRPGATMTMLLRGWGANEAITVTFVLGDQRVVAAQSMTDATGKIKFSFPVPNAQMGRWTIEVSGNAGSFTSATFRMLLPLASPTAVVTTGEVVEPPPSTTADASAAQTPESASAADPNPATPEAPPAS